MRLATLLLLVAAGLAGAATCEEIRAGIAAKIRAAGVAQFSLNIVDSTATAPGRAVGTCDRGNKKIVYLVAPGGAAKPARTEEALLTECKDGRVSVGGDCRKP